MSLKDSLCFTNDKDIPKKFITNSKFEVLSTFNQDVGGSNKNQTVCPEVEKTARVNNFDDHEKNFGLKLLQKWGFEPGKGLGKELQGINEPVKVCLRKGRGGIGFCDSKETSSHLDNKSTSDKKLHKNKNLLSKKVKINETKLPSQYVFSNETINEDVKLKNKQIEPVLNTNILKCKVIDMTKPQPLVFDSYHAIGKCQISMGNNSSLHDDFITLQEFQDSLNIITDKTDQTLVQNDSKENRESEKIVALEIRNKTIGNTEKEYIQNVATSKNDFVKKINDLFNNGDDLTSTEVIKMFEAQCHCHKDYDEIVWSAWVPQAQKIIQSWDCRQPENIIDIIELWLTLIPSWILNNFFDTVVVPKLTCEVDEWNPTTDSVPIHLWLFPWLPYINNQMNTLIYPVIRRKIKTALDAWHPSDCTAKLILEPWSPVFKKQDMDTFLIQNILPKLKFALSNIIINPCKQNLKEWNWVIDWADMMPTFVMAQLLNEFFFPKWFQVLSFWLNHLLNSTSNFEEVTNWCECWKGMFNKELLAEPSIKNNFSKAFKIINNCILISKGFVPNSGQTAPSKNPYISQTRIENLASKASNVLSQSFKDIVQKKCEKRNILFLPLPNQYYNSKQVYKVGNDKNSFKVYIDRGTLFIRHNETTWLPIELDNFLYKAKNC